MKTIYDIRFIGRVRPPKEIMERYVFSSWMGVYHIAGKTEFGAALSEYHITYVTGLPNHIWDGFSLAAPYMPYTPKKEIMYVLEMMKLDGPDVEIDVVPLNVAADLELDHISGLIRNKVITRVAVQKLITGGNYIKEAYCIQVDNDTLILEDYILALWIAAGMPERHKDMIKKINYI